MPTISATPWSSALHLSGVDLAKRVDAAQLGECANTDLAIWLAFKIGGDQVLLPLLVATFLLSRSIVRHPVVVNVCCSWILAGVISSLLLYAHQQTGPEPDRALCIAQTVLISPVPPMTSVAALALVYHTWSTFRPSALRRAKQPKPSRWSHIQTVALLAAPYVTHLCFAAGALLVSLQDPSRVSRSRRFFYCSVDYDPFSNAMALFTAAVCLVATMLEVHLIFMLSRNWRALRRAKLGTGVDIQLIVRVGFFMTYVFCGMIVMVASVFNTESILPDMFAASVGTAFFAVFATQPARLAALHAYFNARVHDMGVGVEVIKRPEDAFVVGRGPRRAWGVAGNRGDCWDALSGQGRGQR
ncbi:hypothetical protein C8Q77DRAFT_905573 [Trametes polyzona]|nr:hypothetical protein C8Q77DRAFT_905573 [Trametes polyzona]